MRTIKLLNALLIAGILTSPIFAGTQQSAARATVATDRVSFYQVPTRASSAKRKPTSSLRDSCVGWSPKHPQRRRRPSHSPLGFSIPCGLL